MTHPSYDSTRRPVSELHSRGRSSRDSAYGGPLSLFSSAVISLLILPLFSFLVLPPPLARSEEEDLSDLQTTAAGGPEVSEKTETTKDKASTKADELPEASHPNLLDEAEYTEAVLAYNARKNKDALRILEIILKRNPGHLNSLEMLALLQKTEGHESESLATYQKILKAKPSAERGPIHFEIATILFKRKRFEVARKFFGHALRRKFNVTACHFFIGLIDLGSKKFSNAASEFREVIRLADNEYRVAAHYYLGVAQYQLGAGTEGTAELIEARDRALQLPTSPLAKQVLKAAEEALKPQDNARWFANLSTLAQSDSNVLLTPDTIPDTAATGKSSAKAIVSAALGRMSTPISTWQWVPSVRTVLNRNFNEAAAEAQFLTSAATLYINHRPLAAETWGVKAEGSTTFQYLLEDGSTSQGSYAPFSYMADLGLFSRFSLTSRWKASFEAGYRPQRFLTDETTGTTQRSGFSAGGRAVLRADQGYGSLLKPDFALSGEYFNTNGVDFRGLNWGVELNNTARILGRDAWTLGFLLQGVDYPNRAEGGRTDLTYTVKSTYVMPITNSIAVLADISWTRNVSNISDIFSYTRTVAGAGLTISF